MQNVLHVFLVDLLFAFSFCVPFRFTMVAYQFTFMHFTSMCIHTNITDVITVLMIVHDKKWRNRVILSHHDQVALDIRPQLTEGA